MGTVVSTTVNADANDVAVIFLGNPGRGKSFLCNLLISQPRFKSSYSANSVTRFRSHFVVNLWGRRVKLYDLPGLIEHDQNKVEENKSEIEAAISENKLCLICYVCSAGVNGRLLNDDVVAFQAINNAYNFDPRCLLFIVNQVRPDRTPVDYEATILTLIEEYMGLKEPVSVCFLPDFNGDDLRRRQDARDSVISLLGTLQPCHCERKKAFKMEKDELAELRRRFESMEKLTAVKLQTLSKEIASQQRAFRKLMQIIKDKVKVADDRAKKAGLENDIKALEFILEESPKIREELAAEVLKENKANM